MQRLLCRVRGGGHSIGFNKHRIVNDNVADDKLVIVNDGDANYVLHNACRSFLAVCRVPAATTSELTSTALSTTTSPSTSSSLSTTAAPTT